jgi:murein DD-endopeptidase MepM/ murein hydrolase activator NlpD
VTSRRANRPRVRIFALLLVSAASSLQGCAARSERLVFEQAFPPSSLSQVLESLIWPLRKDGRRNVRSVYGYRSGVGGAGRYHYGLDLQARWGEPVHSAGAGVVLATGMAGAYGKIVHVDHGRDLSSFYAHLERPLVREGEHVRRGQVIALAGATGNATGPHLHFELRWRDSWVDPLAVLPRLE